MPAEFPLQVYLEVTDYRLDRAASNLRLLQANAASARTKLEQLRTYQTHYHAAFAVRLAQGLAADQLADTQRFLDKLARAAEEQTLEVARQEQRAQRAQADWMALRRQREAIGVLKARHLSAAQDRERLREQKDQDEFSARRFRDRAEGDTN